MNFWKPSSLPLPSFPSTSVMVVDNRVFVLGLDELYRNTMKEFESKTLLPCARTVARTLQIQPAIIPVEGYYHETPELEEYFRWMRSLQEANENTETQVKHLREFQLLWDVTNSPLFGRPQRKGKLFPVGRDPFTQALLDAIPNWGVEKLVKATYDAARQYDDISLVSLAAHTQDAVVLAATRESVVLNAEIAVWGIHEEPGFKYEWRVDKALAEVANRFIETFDRFVPSALPIAEALNAERYYKAYADNEVIGRCVRVGQTEDGSQHYHWAIALAQLSKGELELRVDDFWSEHIWTTQKYRAAQSQPYRMKFFQANGAPEDEWERL